MESTSTASTVWPLSCAQRWNPNSPPLEEGSFIRQVLLLVRKYPRRSVLPLRQHVSFFVRHFDLRQTLSVKNFVLWNDAIFEEKIGRQSIDLVRCQGALFSEGHTSVDVV